MYGPGIDEETAAYFQGVVLPMCRTTPDTGQLILDLQAERELLRREVGPDSKREALVGMTLLLIEARVRTSVEALQAAIDGAYEIADLGAMRARE